MGLNRMPFDWGRVLDGYGEFPAALSAADMDLIGGPEAGVEVGRIAGGIERPGPIVVANRPVPG